MSQETFEKKARVIVNGKARTAIDKQEGIKVKGENWCNSNVEETFEERVTEKNKEHEFVNPCYCGCDGTAMPCGHYDNDGNECLKAKSEHVNHWCLDPLSVRHFLKKALKDQQEEIAREVTKWALEKKEKLTMKWDNDKAKSTVYDSIIYEWDDYPLKK